MCRLYLIVLLFCISNTNAGRCSSNTNDNGCTSNAKDEEHGSFQQLSELNSKWLQATSYPEAAVLLNRPPYSYHLKDLSAPENTSEDLDLFIGLKEMVESRASGVKSCSDDIVQILYNIKSNWVLKMLDSDGKPTSGILRGSLVFPGHFKECTSVYAPRDDKGHGGFHGQYCATAWSLNMGTLNLPITAGLCVPDSCTEKQLERFGGNLLSALGRAPILGKKISSFLNLTSVTCKITEQSPDAQSIVYLVFVFFFISLTLIGSAITVFDRQKKLRTNSTMLDSSILPTSEVNYGTIQAADASYKQLTPSADACNDKHPLALNNNLRIDRAEQTTVEPVVKRIFKCFSAIENGERMLNVKSTEGQLLSVHGIRFLSLTWVILGHTYITAVPMIENKLDALDAMDNLAYQALLQSPFSVDSFFLLSGFLLAYIFLKEADKRNGKINWVLFYVHRLWRLTPAYMVVVFFYIFVFKYIGSGPFWEDYHGDDARGDWWKYLLYINNFIPIHKMAVGWSWYLANDMQFYVISPLFLYPLWRWPKIGFSILTALLIGSWTVTGFISYKYDITPMFIGVAKASSDFAAYGEKMWDFFDLTYDKPYCRIPPYIIGVVLGYALYKFDKKKNFMNWGMQVLGWATAAFCSLSVVYGLYHVDMSKTTALFYNTFSRSAFSVGLAWVIFACETGHGGFIAKLLSWKVLIPFSRLTYCAYLVHPIIVHAYYLGLQTTIYYTELTMVTNFLGFFIMSYALAFAFSLTFESPLMNLEKLVLKK